MADLYTIGPARVERVEQRVEKFAGPRQYGVVIYRAQSLAYPVQGADLKFAEHPEAVVTRILRVRANIDGGCEEPPNAGRLLGHYWEDGARYWCFLEKEHVKSASPAPAAPQKPANGSAVHPKAPAKPSGAPSKPSAPPARQPSDSRDNSAEPWTR